MTTAIVAQTKNRAERLARELGIDGWIFGARSAASFEGIRVDLVLIDAEAKISDEFMSTIRATVLKTRSDRPPRGRVRFITVVERPQPRHAGVQVLGPFETWFPHAGADSWHNDHEGRLVITEAGQRIATYNSWVSVSFIRQGE